MEYTLDEEDDPMLEEEETTELKVRPVAVGETLRRLAGRLLFSQKEVVEGLTSMHPTQIGVAMKGAPEKLACALQELVNSFHKEDPTGDWVILQVDVSNAFNSMLRHEAMPEVLQRCPQAYQFMRTCLAKPAPLFFGGHKIWSKRGFQQGCFGSPQPFRGVCNESWKIFLTCSNTGGT